MTKQCLAALNEIETCRATNSRLQKEYSGYRKVTDFHIEL